VTGPEHYREAEQLVVRAYHHTFGAGRDPAAGAAFAAEAQVHATLALAAATALSGITLTLPDGSDLAADWNRAILADWSAEPKTGPGFLP
jgi:hypothetical protein